MACHFYLEAFLPPALGAMPFPVAGAFAAVFSLAAQLALAALVGLGLGGAVLLPALPPL